MTHAERPTEMLKRQMLANRNAVLGHNPETGKRHFCHERLFRAAFVRDILAIRRELRNRGERMA